MSDRNLNPDCSFILVFIYLFIYLYVYFIIQGYEISTTVPSTTVSGGKWLTRFKVVIQIFHYRPE